jgi:hypothetical protein
VSLLYLSRQAAVARAVYRRGGGEVARATAADAVRQMCPVRQRLLLNGVIDVEALSEEGLLVKFSAA